MEKFFNIYYQCSIDGQLVKINMNKYITKFEYTPRKTEDIFMELNYDKFTIQLNINESQKNPQFDLNVFKNYKCYIEGIDDDDNKILTIHGDEWKKETWENADGYPILEEMIQTKEIENPPIVKSLEFKKNDIIQDYGLNINDNRILLTMNERMIIKGPSGSTWDISSSSFKLKKQVYDKMPYTKNVDGYKQYINDFSNNKQNRWDLSNLYNYTNYDNIIDHQFFEFIKDISNESQGNALWKLPLEPLNGITYFNVGNYIKTVIENQPINLTIKNGDIISTNKYIFKFQGGINTENKLKLFSSAFYNETMIIKENPLFDRYISYKKAYWFLNQFKGVFSQKISDYGIHISNTRLGIVGENPKDTIYWTLSKNSYRPTKSYKEYNVVHYAGNEYIRKNITHDNNSPPKISQNPYFWGVGKTIKDLIYNNTHTYKLYDFIVDTNAETYNIYMLSTLPVAGYISKCKPSENPYFWEKLSNVTDEGKFKFGNEYVIDSDSATYYKLRDVTISTTFNDISNISPTNSMFWEKLTDVTNKKTNFKFGNEYVIDSDSATYYKLRDVSISTTVNDISNISPTNSMFWEKLTETPTNYGYSSNKTYRTGDVVNYKNSTYKLNQFHYINTLDLSASIFNNTIFNTGELSDNIIFTKKDTIEYLNDETYNNNDTTKSYNYNDSVYKLIKDASFNPSNNFNTNIQIDLLNNETIWSIFNLENYSNNSNYSFKTEGTYVKYNNKAYILKDISINTNTDISGTDIFNTRVWDDYTDINHNYNSSYDFNQIVLHNDSLYKRSIDDTSSANVSGIHPVTSEFSGFFGKK